MQLTVSDESNYVVVEWVCRIKHDKSVIINCSVIGLIYVSSKKSIKKVESWKLWRYDKYGIRA